MASGPTLKLREGFAGQDMYVIPRPILARARRHPLVRSIYPTDIGYFPTAAHHYRHRPQGAGQDHLMLCLGGHGYADIDGVRAHLTEGHMLIIPRDVEHVYWAADDAPWSIYWMHFVGDDAAYFVDRIPVKGQPVAVPAEVQNEAVQLFRHCLDALHDGYALRTLVYAAQSAQHILSVLLYRNPELPEQAGKTVGRSQIEAAIDAMHTHLDQPLRLEDFAEISGLSVSHFSELFRAQTGQSPMAYFSQLRVRLACRLLDLSDKPVKQVALETGYGDPYYFSRVFKKIMGLSPERYRAIKKG